MGRSAVVTGVGLLTPLGDHPSVVHDALVTRRTAFAPVELPVGVVTAILGAPYLLWLLARLNRAGRMG